MREQGVLERISWGAHEAPSKARRLYERVRSQVGTLATGVDLPESERDAAIEREVSRRKSKEQ